MHWLDLHSQDLYSNRLNVQKRNIVQCEFTVVKNTFMQTE